MFWPKGFSIFQRYGFRTEKEEEILACTETLLDGNIPVDFKTRHSPRIISTTVLIHFGIILLYTIFSALAIYYGAPRCPKNCRDVFISTPAHEAVFYERVSFNNSLEDKNPFKGEPRQELEEAWYNILKYQNIRVQEEDLRRINRTGIPLNDQEGGYLATLDVFHELHCLNVIREQVYRDFYPDKHTKEMQLLHVDHCIDTLRQTLMCHGDIALLTHTWIPDYRWPWPNFAIDHECRNWDSIMEWTKSRYIPSLKGPIVKHPVLGISWPEDGEDEH